MKKIITFRVVSADLVSRPRGEGSTYASDLRAIGLRVVPVYGAKYRLTIETNARGQHEVRYPATFARVYRRGGRRYMLACYLGHKWAGRRVRLTLKRLR